MIVVIIDELRIDLQHILMMPERTFDAVIGKYTFLQGPERHDPELLKAREFCYQIDVKGFAKHFHPIVSCQVFKGKNGQAYFAVTDITHVLKS